jgi:hypothetical protein
MLGLIFSYDLLNKATNHAEVRVLLMEGDCCDATCLGALSLVIRPIPHCGTPSIDLKDIYFCAWTSL